MKKPLLLALAAMACALSSCTSTYQTTFLVQEPTTGISMYARYRDVKDGELPSDRQVAAMTHRMTRGLTPEELGREYFPGQGPDGKATVSIAPHTGAAPARAGWSKACYVAQVTVSAKASRQEFQQALNRINSDFYKRAVETEMVVKLEELPLVVNGKPEPPTYSFQTSKPIPGLR